MIVLCEVRDARDWPAPWFNWLLVDTDADLVVGYFTAYARAEAELERLVAEQEEATA